MGRKIEIVMVPHGFRQIRTPGYSTRQKHADQARLAAERNIELERSGELKRRKLEAEADKLKWKLRQLKWVEYMDREMLDFIEQLIESKVDHQTWIEQVKAVYTSLVEALKERKQRAEEEAARQKAEHEARWQEKLREELPLIQKMLDMIHEGIYPDIDGEVMLKADHLKMAGMITEVDHLVLAKIERQLYLERQNPNHKGLREFGQPTPAEAVEAAWDTKLGKRSKEEETQYVYAYYSRGMDVYLRNRKKFQRAHRLTNEECIRLHREKNKFYLRLRYLGQDRSDQRRLWRRETLKLHGY